MPQQSDQAKLGDSRLLVLDEKDNVVIARSRIVRGELLKLDSATTYVPDTIEIGFKIARVAIAQGEKISKYGASIGSATRDIAPGEVVHTHNMRSDYLPTYHGEAETRFTRRRT